MKFAVVSTLSAFTVCSLAFSQPTGQDSDAPVLLKVTRQEQEHTYWCWAASAQMVMTFEGKNVSQCEQVKSHYPGPGIPDASGACNPPPITASSQVREDFEDNCDLTGWPEFKKWGFFFTKTDKSELPWDQVKVEIDNNRPFCFTKEWVDTPDHGHMMVVFGYAVIKGNRYVFTWDPTPGIIDHQALLYDKYVKNTAPDPGDNTDPYTHWDDYYNIRKQSP